MDEWKDPISAAMKKKFLCACNVRANARAKGRTGELNIPLVFSRLAPDEIDLSGRYAKVTKCGNVDFGIFVDVTRMYYDQLVTCSNQLIHHNMNGDIVG